MNNTACGHACVKMHTLPEGYNSIGYIMEGEKVYKLECNGCGSYSQQFTIPEDTGLGHAASFMQGARKPIIWTSGKSK